MAPTFSKDRSPNSGPAPAPINGCLPSLVQALFGRAVAENVIRTELRASFNHELAVCLGNGTFKENGPRLGNLLAELACRTDGPETLLDRLSENRLRNCFIANAWQGRDSEFKAGKVLFHVTGFTHHRGTYEIGIEWNTLNNLTRDLGAFQVRLSSRKV